MQIPPTALAWRAGDTAGKLAARALYEYLPMLLFMSSNLKMRMGPETVSPKAAKQRRVLARLSLSCTFGIELYSAAMVMCMYGPDDDLRYKTGSPHL